MRDPSETRFRVRYAETDQMGVVYYANYLVWMEIGRVELCKSLGFNYRDMERDDGIYLAVADVACRYRAPARFDDEITVKTWLEDANKRLVVFAYEIRTGDRVLATGSTRHVFVSRQLERTRLPDKYYPLFGISPERLVTS
ncbi:MAG: thioesterase family protein [Bryobacteraceae bacterium]|jgi:acyl-CoA thioester hydrolase